MEVKNGDKDSGAAVILATQVPGGPPRQLFYEDDKGLIRSVLNGYIFAGEGTAEYIDV